MQYTKAAKEAVQKDLSPVIAALGRKQGAEVQDSPKWSSLGSQTAQFHRSQSQTQ
jgi:hypothetical protein